MSRHWWPWIRMLLIALAAIGLGVLLLLMFGLRPILGALRSWPTTGSRLDVREPALLQAAASAQLRAKAAAALNPAQQLKVLEREELHDRIGTLARSSPEQVAQLLRSWMLQKQP